MPEQAILGDFPKAIDDAVMDSNEAHQNQTMQLLSDPAKAADFARVMFDLFFSVMVLLELFLLSLFYRFIFGIIL